MTSFPLILAFTFDGGGGANAGMLAALLPPGRIWRSSTCVLGKLLLGSADELDRVDGRVDDLLDEAEPATMDELLPDQERELGLVATGTIDERRANVTARLVRQQHFRPADFRDALAPLLVQDPADVVVLERSRAEVIALGDDREIFRFFIYRDPALPGAAFIASAQALVDQMAPSHTKGYVIESIAFATDDPHSLTDRDITGG
jgi:hypothetical protein